MNCYSGKQRFHRFLLYETARRNGSQIVQSRQICLQHVGKPNVSFQQNSQNHILDIRHAGWKISLQYVRDRSVRNLQNSMLHYFIAKKHRCFDRDRYAGDERSISTRCSAHVSETQDIIFGNTKPTFVIIFIYQAGN